MPLDYHDLDRAAYEQLRFQLLANAEENGNAKYDPYPDGRGYPTIGYGFNLGDRAVREKVLGVMGVGRETDGYRALSAEAQRVEDAYVEELRLVLVELGNTATNDTATLNRLQSELDEIMARRAGDPAVPYDYKQLEFGFMDHKDIELAFERIIQTYEDTVTQWLQTIPGFDDIPDSTERLALVSLAYNTRNNETTGYPSGLGNNLKTALADGDRAEAWYEIRYNTNRNALADPPMAGDFAGIAKRRFLESELFGLHDEGVTADNISRIAALDIEYMFDAQRETILAYEARYGINPDGSVTGRDMIGAANGDFRLLDAAGNQTGYWYRAPTLNGGVHTLNESLRWAADKLGEGDVYELVYPATAEVTPEPEGSDDTLVGGEPLPGPAPEPTPTIPLPTIPSLPPMSLGQLGGLNFGIKLDLGDLSPNWNLPSPAFNLNGLGGLNLNGADLNLGTLDLPPSFQNLIEAAPQLKNQYESLQAALDAGDWGQAAGLAQAFINNASQALTGENAVNFSSDTLKLLDDATRFSQALDRGDLVGMLTTGGKLVNAFGIDGVEVDLGNSANLQGLGALASLYTALQNGDSAAIFKYGLETLNYFDALGEGGSTWAGMSNLQGNVGAMTSLTGLLNALDSGDNAAALQSGLQLAQQVSTLAGNTAEVGNDTCAMRCAA